MSIDERPVKVWYIKLNIIQLKAALYILIWKIPNIYSIKNSKGQKCLCATFCIKKECIHVCLYLHKETEKYTKSNESDDILGRSEN